jgi:predicted nucleic-acid-binding Zn-ribbon protein
MTCAKCSSSEVRVIDVEWPGRQIGSTIAVGVFTSAKVNHHVCTNCGFVESYVADRDALKKIAEKWPLANQ